MNNEASASFSTRRSRALKILVIDDDYAVRELLQMTLKEAGHEVLAAADGEVGRAIALREQPDIILCDVYMPGLSGHQVLNSLRSDYQTRHIPFIFISGCHENQSIRLGMAAGAAEYIAKPFNPEELDEAIGACERKLTSFARLTDPLCLQAG